MVNSKIHVCKKMVIKFEYDKDTKCICINLIRYIVNNIFLINRNFNTSYRFFNLKK